jgi:hypothetical protein
LLQNLLVRLNISTECACSIRKLTHFIKRETEEGDDRVHIEKVASPEWDKPHSLRKIGFAGMGQAAFPTTTSLRRNGTSRIPYEKMASPEWDKPHSLRKDGFAGMGQAAFPTKNWLRRNGTSRIPYE